MSYLFIFAFIPFILVDIKKKKNIAVIYAKEYSASVYL